jgi:hypothetical protein
VTIVTPVTRAAPRTRGEITCSMRSSRDMHKWWRNPTSGYVGTLMSASERTTVHKLSARAQVVTTCALLMVVGFCSTPMASAPRKPPLPFAISALQAMLFYEHTGTLSPDVLAEPKMVLRNRRTAQGRSTTMLVVVEITGEPGAFDPRRKVVLTATDAHTLNFTKTSEVGILSEEGKFFVGFWLYNTGCYPMTLTARLTRQSRAAFVQRVINFQCGD